MAIWDKIYSAFKRKTNTTSFIPQIDGLRFLAIMMVLLYHLNIFITVKVPFSFTRPTADYWWMFNLLDSDRKGVFLFFVISGFILALPFARAARGEGKPVELKHYYLRRLTRLEPPYILVMVACFFGILLLPGHEFAAGFPHTFFGLLPRLGASLIYMHNIIFPQYLSLNPVAWSLEIEVQFYLLVPLLVKVFKLPQVPRRILLIAAPVVFIFLQHLLHPTVDTLFSYIQYFLAGFLLADLYLSQVKIKLPAAVSLGIGLLCLLFIGYADLRPHNYLEYIFPVVILGFYLLVLTDPVWKKVFSLRFITAIGGMCYSIYLLHYNIIPLVGNYTIFHNFSHSYPLVYLWQTLILLPTVLVVSSVFYLLIERPCMDKDWPVKLWHFATGRKVKPLET
jgi:peptidoglycan/LPS O-acetylase OafA/YrhL